MAAQRICTAHRARGRIRLKVHNARNNPHALSLIKQAIAPMDGVKHVEVNPVTGSVVVRYDPALYGKFQKHLETRGEATGAFHLEPQPPAIGEGGDLMREIEDEAEFLAGHSETARVIVEYCKGLNQSIRRATDNTVDLRVLLPLGLAAYSVFEIGIEASTPLWVTLGMFSFNSFVALHGAPEPPQPAAEETARPARPAKSRPRSPR